MGFLMTQQAKPIWARLLPPCLGHCEVHCKAAGLLVVELLVSILAAG